VKQILVVDDEKSIRTLIGKILEMNGHGCTLAADASEARAVLKDQAFDLILCDIDMPGESGLDFIQYAVSEYVDTAAVMVTAMDDPMIAEVALKTGVYDYIIKPFEQNGLLIRISNALRRRQLEIDNRAYRESLEKMVADRTAALRESEARLRAIFGAVEHVSFVMIDRSGEEESIIEFSPGAERLLGYSRKEVLGKPAAMLNLPGDISVTLDTSRPSGQETAGFTRELLLTRKTGEKIPVLFSTYPIFNGKGDTSAALVVCVDVSDRKTAEKELQKSMAKLGKALEGKMNRIIFPSRAFSHTTVSNRIPHYIALCTLRARATLRERARGDHRAFLFTSKALQRRRQDIV